VLSGNATIVETRKRDGSWVSTPVTMIEYAPGAVFMTDSRAGKLKRIRNFSDVRVASSTMRGERTGELRHAGARILTGQENQSALRAMRRAHPIIFGIILRLRYRAPVMVELSELSEVVPE